jgi:hypothetical protein
MTGALWAASIHPQTFLSAIDGERATEATRIARGAGHSQTPIAQAIRWSHWIR